MSLPGRTRLNRRAATRRRQPKSLVQTRKRSANESGLNRSIEDTKQRYEDRGEREHKRGGEREGDDGATVVAHSGGSHPFVPRLVSRGAIVPGRPRGRLSTVHRIRSKM